MANFIVKTNESILKSLHPLLKKELLTLNKLDEAIEEIKSLNSGVDKMSLTSYCVIDEYSFLWPTIISFGSEKLGVSVNIYKN